MSNIVKNLINLEAALRSGEDDSIFADTCLAGIREIERLQAECERLQHQLNMANHNHDAEANKNLELKTECERLRGIIDATDGINGGGW